jgi:hypothetical protein
MALAIPSSSAKGCVILDFLRKYDVQPYTARLKPNSGWWVVANNPTKDLVLCCGSPAPSVLGMLGRRNISWINVKHNIGTCK